MQDVPTAVGCESQGEHEPPKRKYSSHPGLVSGDSEFLRQNVRARSEQDVHSREFGDGSKRRVHRRQGVVSLPQLGGNPGKHMNAE
jgi:hypothetical protein